jgi:hypothetical protein
MLTREEWTSGPGTPPAVKELIWFTDGSRLREDWGWGQWAICRQKAQHLSRKTWFYSEVCGTRAFLGVTRQNIRRKIKCWMDNQHLVTWRGPCSTQKQAQELISGPDLATRAQLLSFNTTQSRVVIGLLTGQNTLRQHLHVMGLSDNPICRKCGTEEETSTHVLRACEALASLTHI